MNNFNDFNQGNGKCGDDAKGPNLPVQLHRGGGFLGLAGAASLTGAVKVRATPLSLRSEGAVNSTMGRGRSSGRGRRIIVAEL
jgi:hypothetical protein